MSQESPSVRNVYQIWIDPRDGNSIPEQYKGLLNSIVRSTSIRQEIYTGDSLRAFIHTHYGQEVVSAYDSLIPLAYKADLGRYCLLYKLGGWYFDIEAKLAIDLPHTNEISGLVFKDAPLAGRHSWDVANGVMYFKEAARPLEIAIRFILSNVQTKFMGTNPLCPTGPNLFGRALAVHGVDHTVLTGSYELLTPNHAFENPCFILPSGQIIAYGKQRLKLKPRMTLEVNYEDYSTMYYQNKVYK
jgi:hypothetical protein